MNVLWVLIAIGAAFVFLRLWNGWEEPIGPAAPGASGGTASGAEAEDGGRSGDPWHVKLALIVSGLAIAFALEIGPWLLLDALL